MNRSEKWLRRLDQQDRLGKAVVVEAASEMNPRLDRHDLEGADVQTQGLEGKRFHDLYEIGAQNEDIYAGQNGRRKFLCIGCDVPDPLKLPEVAKLLTGELRPPE
jgi:hypothetical protein